MSSYMTLYKRQDITSGGLCTTTSGTQNYTRPNMKLSLSSSSVIASGGSSSARLQNEGITIPKELQTNFYPNPIIDKLNVMYTITEESATVSLDIYNLMGNKVKSFDMQNSTLGENNVEFNILNENLQNGIYFVCLNINGEKITKKLVLDKR